MEKPRNAGSKVGKQGRGADKCGSQSSSFHGRWHVDTNIFMAYVSYTCNKRHRWWCWCDVVSRFVIEASVGKTPRLSAKRDDHTHVMSKSGDFKQHSFSLLTPCSHNRIEYMQCLSYIHVICMTSTADCVISSLINATVAALC